MAHKRVEKRGQMMIWVIVALTIVATIILFFILRGRVVKPEIEEFSENPKSFISQCVKKYVNEAVDIILPHGGFINPEHFKVYKNINVGYLCYNAGNYNPCVNEHPMLLNEIKEQINGYIAPRIDGCFNDYKKEIEKRAGDVEYKDMNLKIELSVDRIYVNIDGEMSIMLKEQQLKFDRFEDEIINPIYNLARVAMEITSQEAKYCYFEYGGYMILYPRFKITRFSMSDYTEIYTIKDKKTEKEMNIAIRSCAIPPGL